MRRARILVLGGANLDIKCRLSVSPSGSSDPATISITAGGVARNVAHNLVLLGHDVRMVTAFAEDATQAAICQGSPPRLHLEAIRQPSGRSGIYCAMLDDQGELIQAASDMDILQALTPKVIDTALQKATDFVFADCNLPAESLAQLIEKTPPLPLFIDTVSNVKAEKLKPLLDRRELMLSPNIEELQILAGTKIHDDEGLHLACARLHAKKVSILLVGLGKEGAYLSLASGATHRIRPKNDKIIDVTGAGDAACAGMIHGLIQEWPAETCLNFSQKMANLACQSTASIAEGIEDAIVL